MVVKYKLSALLVEIQDALLRKDFEKLAEVVGEASLEQCHFSEEAIQSPCLEDYASWWMGQREYIKAAEVYQFVFENKNNATIRPSSLLSYQSSLAFIGQKERAIEIGLKAIKENWGYVAICCWHVANYYMESGRYEDAKRFYLLAKDNSLPDKYDIDANEKLLFLDNLLSFYGLWDRIKTSNFSLEAGADHDFQPVDYAQFLHLANTGDGHLSVAAVDWSKNNGLISGFLNPDAVSAGIEFQSGYADGIIDNYIYETIKTGEMSYLCPLTGEVLKSKVSIYIDNPDHTIAYFFNGTVPFFLFVEILAGARNGLYFPINETYVHFDSTRAWTNACVRLKYLLTTKWGMFKKYFEQNNSMAIITNVYNHWGHTILNEYPSLNYLFEKGLLNRSTHILSGMHGYINIKDIFDIDFEHEAHFTEPEAITDYIATNHLFVIRPTNGRYRMPLSLRKRVLDSCNRLCGGDVRQQFNKTDFAFVVWIEIRSNHRICLNQEELACEVVRHLDEKNLGRTAIFIAGWSKKLAVHRDFDTRMIREDSEIAEKITEGVAKFSNTACISIVGRSIYEKIVWAKLADVHVCTYSSGITFPFLVDTPVILHCNTGLCHVVEQMASSGYISDVSAKLQYGVEKEFIEDGDSQDIYSRTYKCKPEGLLKQLDLALTDQGILK